MEAKEYGTGNVELGKANWGTRNASVSLSPARHEWGEGRSRQNGPLPPVPLHYQMAKREWWQRAPRWVPPPPSWLPVDGRDKPMRPDRRRFPFRFHSKYNTAGLGAPHCQTRRAHGSHEPRNGLGARLVGTSCPRPGGPGRAGDQNRHRTPPVNPITWFRSSRAVWLFTPWLVEPRCW